ncbi:hypothetical protein ACSXAB_07070 [Clostridium perfringens]|nr:hypothetical protein [Clostridium perfringens]
MEGKIKVGDEEFDLSEFWLLDKPTNYKVLIGFPKEELERRAADMYMHMEKIIAEKGEMEC